MRFDIITIFPEAFTSYLSSSMLKRAQKKRLIRVRIHDLRRFTTDRHRTVDDKPYGGGPGMVIKLEPLVEAVSSLKVKSKKQKVKTILLSAAGKQVNATMAAQWAKRYNRFILIAGHYEGVDARIKKIFPMEEISIGPYILTGGELAAMVVIDAVSRHIPGVLGKEASLEEKRYGVGVPVFTRPEVFRWRGKAFGVPKVLLSGDHQNIDEWRRKYAR